MGDQSLVYAIPIEQRFVYTPLGIHTFWVSNALQCYTQMFKLLHNAAITSLQ